MQAPNWLEIKTRGDASTTPATIYVSARIKRWHPGFWLFCLRALLRGE